MPHSKTVLFVCTGNTCRSPMAEGILKAALKSSPDASNTCSKQVSVLSAGVAAMAGQPASRETQAILEESGASIPGFRSQEVSGSLLDQADIVIAMTSAHADVLKQYFGNFTGEVNLLTDFIHSDEGVAGLDVPDPIGMGRPAYLEVAEVMALAMPGIIEALAE